jgi:hypothetical protein
MDGIDPVGRLLIIGGIILAGLGLLIVVAPNLALGRLPGDIHIDRGNVQIFIPFGTMILISVVLTILLNVFGFFGRDR